jgi:hypothetical protein
VTVSRRVVQFGGTFSHKKVSAAPAIARGLIAVVVCHVLMHGAPEQLDGVEVRTIGRNEVQPDPAARLGQPVLYKRGVVVAGVVEIDVDCRQRVS